MRAQVIQTIEVTLVLNQGEAAWLKGLMQNPILSEESEADKTYRERFFHAIPDTVNNPLHQPKQSS